MELLRIAAMLAVVMVHLDGASLSLPEPSHSLSAVSIRDWWVLSVESLTIIGVNCFTLISGYFGIKASFTGLLKFTLQCIFYSVLIYLFSIFASSFLGIGKYAWAWVEFGKSWMVFTHTDLWYVPAYLGLYLLSPFLNIGIKTMSKYNFQIVLGLFITFNVWAGWLWGGHFNQNGYTIVQLIMMYLIGRYIGEYVNINDSIRMKTRCIALSCYLYATIAITLMAVFVDGIHTYAYNSPLVLLSSISLFMLFTTFRIQSKIVNTLASSAFAVYLIHKNPYVWVMFVRPLSRYLWSHCSLTEYTVAFILLSITIYLMSCAIDFARRKLFLFAKL